MSCCVVLLLFVLCVVGVGCLMLLCVLRVVCCCCCLPFVVVCYCCSLISYVVAGCWLVLIVSCCSFCVVDVLVVVWFVFFAVS